MGTLVILQIRGLRSMRSGGGGWVVSGSGKGVQNLMGLVQWGGGGTRLSKNSCTYDPPIYDITSGCKVAALFWREAHAKIDARCYLVSSLL